MVVLDLRLPLADLSVRSINGKLAELQNDWTEPTMPKVGKPDSLIKHAALATVVATAGLLYTALTHEPDLAEFDRKELESLIESQRPALLVNASIEDRRQQFARLMMDYAEQENERLRAVRAFIPGIIERQTKHVDQDPALALLIEHFELDKYTRSIISRQSFIFAWMACRLRWLQHKQPLSQHGVSPGSHSRQ